MILICHCHVTTVPTDTDSTDPHPPINELPVFASGNEAVTTKIHARNVPGRNNLRVPAPVQGRAAGGHVLTAGADHGAGPPPGGVPRQEPCRLLRPAKGAADVPLSPVGGAGARAGAPHRPGPPKNRMAPAAKGAAPVPHAQAEEASVSFCFLPSCGSFSLNHLSLSVIVCDI